MSDKIMKIRPPFSPQQSAHLTLTADKLRRLCAYGHRLVGNEDAEERLQEILMKCDELRSLAKGMARNNGVRILESRDT